MAGGPADVRKLFLFTTTQNYFGLRPELWDQPPLSNCPEVNNFLDDGNQMLLRVQRSDAGLAFSNTIDFDDTKDKVLVFFKLRPEVITDDNLHRNILVSSMLESPVNSLYQAVRQVFAPMLLKEFYNLDSLSLLEVVDLVETTRDVVDDVWRQTEHDHYPESRMLHLLDIIDFRLDFENRCRGVPGDASGPLSGKNLSEVVNNIVWVRQLELKVDDTIKIAEALLSDLSGFRSFHRSAEDLLDQFKLYEQEQFDDWSREVQSGLSDSSRIMELDPNDGSLKVHYSDRLVILLREVRQLSALGFVIPAKIQQVANVAQKFCKQAIILKQGFQASDMHAWRQHWNHQLYKALEHQYQMGLEALNENLPEINVDLTYNAVKVDCLNINCSPVKTVIDDLIQKLFDVLVLSLKKSIQKEPNFSLAYSISKDIESCAQIWALYEEFQQGLQEMANEDWITYRTKTYLFEEFLVTWHDRLRKVEEHSVMTVKLQSEVDKYKILCLAEQIKFTEDVENAIKDHSLHQIETQLVAKLEHYTSVDTSSEDPGNSESGILELKLKALILDIIHNIDIVKQLNQVQVHTTDDWAWKKQVRFYMKSDHTCYVHMVDSELQYTYEYQGIDVKSMGRIFVGLVKCGAWGCFDEFNRLEEAVLSAVSMQIQTIQDALKNHRTVCELLGKEGIDVKSMGRIFVGLVKCGAWGCFDEFNRLEEAVLSAVSMQIQTIQDALKNHRTVCELLGKEVGDTLRDLASLLHWSLGIVASNL
ncbi:hypothetical protein A6R68_01554 [Neotoma lepida]|uniref:Dynein heavy chain tail domain-containing protein n=1 Tax=Neotoma lepida TaxID=56216 RepID=A0A1A6GVE3_NEOLE|nr:hypothetical protein A6R68_01554 [Neotoma lepida]